jgi:hypothetical protein
MNKFEEMNNKKEKLEDFSNWTRANIEKEGGEFERVIKKFYPNLDSYTELVEYIKDTYETSDPVKLNPEIWQELENTDSNELSVGDFEKLRDIATQVGRDYESIQEGFKNGIAMERPIIIKIPEQNHHLVSGNTRLCSAKVLNITPEVYILELNKQSNRKD